MYNSVLKALRSPALKKLTILILGDTFWYQFLLQCGHDC